MHMLKIASILPNSSQDGTIQCSNLSSRSPTSKNKVFVVYLMFIASTHLNHFVQLEVVGAADSRELRDDVDAMNGRLKTQRHELGNVEGLNSRIQQSLSAIERESSALLDSVGEYTRCLCVCM